MAALPRVGPEPLPTQGRGHGNTLWLQVCRRRKPCGARVGAWKGLRGPGVQACPILLGDMGVLGSARAGITFW